MIEPTTVNQPPLLHGIKPLRIGPVLVDPPILQAPMAGFTNFAYRHILREFGGVGLLATEMISAEGFVRMTGGVKGAPERLWGVAEEPRPLAVQMWDNDPETLAEVGRRLAQEYRVTVVDLNFGCPVRRVTDAHSGSYLLNEPSRMGRIIERVVKACAPTPVTAKIRLGCTHRCITAEEVATVVEASGASALTVHGRVAEDFFKGQADWDRIATLKTRLKRIPLIGNGDLDSAQKVVEAFKKYEIDGVMIARAGLTRPWLFREAEAAIRGLPLPPEPDLYAQRELVLQHHRAIVEHFGEHKGNLLMRRYACNYANGKRGARLFRTFINKVVTNADFIATVEQYFPRSGTEVE